MSNIDIDSLYIKYNKSLKTKRKLIKYNTCNIDDDNINKLYFRLVTTNKQSLLLFLINNTNLAAYIKCKIIKYL